jgi:Cu/Ag efflux protein CusF
LRALVASDLENAISTQERPMRTAKTLFLAAAAISSSICMSATAAEQSATGMITGINRLNGTIAIRPIQDGTVGQGPGAGAEEFRVQDGAMLDVVHAGDRVTFSSRESGGVKTITKLDRQK